MAILVIERTPSPELLTRSAHLQELSMGRTEHYANRDASDTFVGPAVRV
jgi:hypothetical protein